MKLSGDPMSNDDRLSGALSPSFPRSLLASLLVLVLAIASAVMVAHELTKSEVATAHLEIARLITPLALSPEWFSEMSDSEYNSYRQTQTELLCSKSTLTLAVRDAAIGHNTFLAQNREPVEWLQKNLKIDYPNHA